MADKGPGGQGRGKSLLAMLKQCQPGVEAAPVAAPTVAKPAEPVVEAPEPPSAFAPVAAGRGRGSLLSLVQKIQQPEVVPGPTQPPAQFALAPKLQPAVLPQPIEVTRQQSVSSPTLSMGRGSLLGLTQKLS